MNIDGLSEADRRHLASIINAYGEGAGPVADEHTLKYFKQPYVNECLQTAWNENTDEERRGIINSIKEGLAA